MRRDFIVRTNVVSAELSDAKARLLREEGDSVVLMGHNLCMNYDIAGDRWHVNGDTKVDAVICGSFRRDPLALRRDYDALVKAGCRVTSPADIDFVAEVDGFVLAKQELQRTSTSIEHQHLLAMEDAHFVWLHCPGGYVGRSAAMELGFARALGLRIFASNRPDDVTLADMVERCESPSVAVSLTRQDLGDAPSHALISLQAYYRRAAEARGWSDESVDESLNFLQGEVDELSAAVRDAVIGPIALELADVQLYLVHLANLLNVNLGEAVQDKERINSERFDSVTKRLAA